MRSFLLRLLFSCSCLLNSPPFKALLLFEKPHVRATPSRFAHSTPEQRHRAPRAFADRPIGFALGDYCRATPSLQELHLLAVCQPHKKPVCSGGSCAISAQRRRSRWGLSPKCEPWPTPGRPSPMSSAEGGDPQARHHSCDRCLRFREKLSGSGHHSGSIPPGT